MNCCFSQTAYEKRFGVTEFDATKHERMYRVQIDDYQITELIECKNGEFKGTTFLHKNDNSANPRSRYRNKPFTLLVNDSNGIQYVYSGIWINNEF